MYIFKNNCYRFVLNLKEGEFEVKLARPGDYDMAGIRAQKIYEQNPEDQLFDKERLTIVAKIIRENPSDCVFARYMRMVLVEGYSLLEIATMENTPPEIIKERMNHVMGFIKQKIKNKEF